MKLPWTWWRRADASRPAFAAQGAACLLFAVSLGACSPSAPGDATAQAALSEDVLSHGQAIYEQLCAQCHYDGQGAPLAPSLVGSPLVKNSAAEVVGTILHGRQGTFLVNGKPLEGGMPAQDSLSDEDIAAVVTYVRHTFGKVDQLTTPADVAALR